MKKIFYLLILSVALFMQACGTKQENQAKAVQETPKVQTVEFKIAKNYFFNNNAEIPENPIVSTQVDFERLYGMAAVMGKDGMPTPIDFGKEFVIGIVLPITNDNTEIIPETLVKEGDVLTLNYKLNIIERDMSWSMRPMALIVVDRKYLAKSCVLKETK